MSTEKGNLSIHSENIFPIIKKWLYSDHDIFVRELISNGCDAITKLKKLDAMGETSLPEDNEFKIEVIVDDKEKTLTFIDNGIGMTDEEVKQYINQIAFSGAEDFLNKYKDKANEDQIIGHFGLGFYSAFMVAEKVTIDTLSYKEGAKAVRWVSDGGNEYEMSDSDRTERGTKITLSIGEDGKDFLNEWTVKSTIQKYCSLMPIEIYLINPNKEEPKVENEEENGEVKEPEAPKPLNDTTPLYLKKPNECTDEEYKEFYRKIFMDFKEPLFWIHLNMDYPFNLKGILYFPKLGNQFDTMEGQIKLYNNQVFVADNIKEVIPEFLLLLKGVLDCPDLPLNVSRSFLQNDGFVKKISNYITKKVADKLNSLYKKEKESYEKFWDDIHPFIKFGCLKDDKFFDKTKGIILYKTTTGDYVTLEEYLDRNKEKHENKVYYVTDETLQSQYIKMFKDNGMEAVIMNTTIDQPYISHIEMKESENNIKFARIDADLTDSLKDEDSTSEEDNKKLSEEVQTVFRKALANENLTVTMENLKSEDISAMIILPEESRRMQDMSKMYGMFGMDSAAMPSNESLLLNKKNKLVKYIIDNKDNENTDIFCNQIYDLAMISHKQLSPEAMTKFIERSNKILQKLI
ncbi:molecular chaperone HtpG [Vallitalea guaymasensis]|uniref:Molecular chaperone HtpG n=1 Tax=Vallitalea guaymasensis TaxID=1185412 RepID=A0A8J8SBA2_9FIRM|nr:molecular chaperone HtpG [Vallitalea guaymasensis]QUH28195.1 molecular chaperone HtpG [Vallitalea guaymasensis]